MIIAISPIPMFGGSGQLLTLYNFTVYPNTTLMCTYRITDISGNALTPPFTSSLTPLQYTGWSGQANDDVYLPICFCQNIGVTYISGVSY